MRAASVALSRRGNLVVRASLTPSPNLWSNTRRDWRPEMGFRPIQKTTTIHASSDSSRTTRRHAGRDVHGFYGGFGAFEGDDHDDCRHRPARRYRNRAGRHAKENPGYRNDNDRSSR